MTDVASSPASSATPAAHPLHGRNVLARLPFGAWVYIGALSLYLVTWPGQFFEVDPEGRLQVARNILERHTVESQPTDEFITAGPDRKMHSWQFLGQSVLFMVPYLAARTTADLVGLSDYWRGYAIRGVLSLINPALAAGVAALAYSILSLLGLSRTVSAATGLVICFATVQWWYGLSAQDPTPVVFGLLLMAFAVLRAETATCPAGWLVAAGAAASFAVLTRPDSLLALVPGIGFIVATALRRQARPLAWMAWGTVGAAPLLALMLWYNWARFGSPFDTGSPHVGRLFNYPYLYGLYGLLLSPGRSIFLHAPAVLIALLGTHLVARRSPRLLWLTVGGFLGYTLFYAGQAHWQHLQEWTVRHTVPGVVLLSLQLGFVLDRLFGDGRSAPVTAGNRRLGRGMRSAVVALLVVSILFQFLSVSASTKRVGHVLTATKAELGEANVDLVNDFRYSALWMQFEACMTVWTSMARGVPWTKEVGLVKSGQRLTSSEQLERGRQYYISPFWWVTCRYLLGGPVWPFVLPPLALLALFGFAVRRICTESAPPNPAHALRGGQSEVAG